MASVAPEAKAQGESTLQMDPCYSTVEKNLENGENLLSSAATIDTKSIDSSASTASMSPVARTTAEEKAKDRKTSIVDASLGTIGLKKTKTTRFVVTDAPDEPEFIQHSPPKNENRPNSITPSRRRTGKTERKGRFTITDLDPDSPEPEGKKRLESEELVSALDDPQAATLFERDFLGKSSADFNDNPPASSPCASEPGAKPKPPLGVIGRSATAPSFENGKHPLYGQLHIPAEGEVDNSSRPSSAPTAAIPTFSQLQDIAASEKPSNPKPGKKVDASVLDRLIDSLMVEQTRTRDLFQELEQYSENCPHEQVAASYSPYQPKTTTSQVTLPPVTPQTFKGKHEALYAAFLRLQCELMTYQKENLALSERNQVVEARLVHETRANHELRAQLELLTQYTESILQDDSTNSPRALSPKKKMTESLSEPRLDPVPMPEAIATRAMPPASFAPRVSSADSSEVSQRRKSFNACIKQSQGSSKVFKRLPLLRTSSLNKAEDQAEITLDKMISSQASNLAERLSSSSLSTPTHQTMKSLAEQKELKAQELKAQQTTWSAHSCPQRRPSSGTNGTASMLQQQQLGPTPGNMPIGTASPGLVQPLGVLHTISDTSNVTPVLIPPPGPGSTGFPQAALSAPPKLVSSLSADMTPKAASSM